MFVFVSAAMSSVQSLRDFIGERLTAAAEEILREFEKTIVRYEEEIARQCRLLDNSQKTQSLRNSAVLAEHHGSPDEDLRDKDAPTSVKQEESQIKDEVEELCISQDEELLDLKEETDSLMIPPYEEDHCFEDYLNIHQVITRLTATNVPEELTSPADAETLAEKQDDHDKSHISKTVSLSGSRSCSDSKKLKSFKQKSQKLPEGERFPCKVCGKSFRTAAILVAHMRIHTGEKPFSCNVCGKHFTACGTLANHMITHVNKRPFSCSLCDKSFKQRRHLNVHMRVHSGEKPYSCEECGLSYKSNSALKSHRRVHAADEDPESTDQGADATGSPIASEKPCTKETRKNKSYTCEQCGKSFSQDLGLMRHMRLHTDERPFECKVCGKTFKQSVSLKNHTRIHTGEKPFSCKVCGRSFTLGSTLIRHMKVHTGERPFLCKVCGRAFGKMDHLKGHMRIHTGERPFSCQVCGKSFKLSVNLKSHLRIHTGERPFSCQVCGRHFVQNSQLKVHMRMHVTGPDEPFACDECGQTFSQMSKLKRHMAAHSGHMSIACEACGETFGSTLTFNDHMKIHASKAAFDVERC